jgi:hypothetical protein
MNRPIEYRILRTKAAHPNRVDAKGRQSADSIYRTWVAGHDLLDEWDQFTEDEANYQLSGYKAAEDVIWRRLWPDGVVDLISELVYCDGYTINGRYEPRGEWRRLEPGFKDSAPGAEVSKGLTTDFAILTREEKIDLVKHWYWHEEPKPSYATLARRVGMSSKQIERWIKRQ